MRARMLFRIGELLLDDQALTLSRGGERIVVQRRVLDLILYLVRHRDRVVGDEELFANVWGSVAVTRASIAHAAMKARRALGDVGRAPTMIESVRGRGLRLVATVTVEVAVGAAPAEGPPLADLVGSFSIGTEALLDLARSIDADELAETLQSPLLIFPLQAFGGNPWAVETASASFDAVGIEAPKKIEVFELFTPGTPLPCVLTVGRARTCNIAVRAPSISKVHARFEVADNVVITDLGSHNGTRLSGHPLRPHEARLVQVGDSIHFGQVLSWVMSARELHALVARM